MATKYRIVAKKGLQWGAEWYDRGAWMPCRSKADNSECLFTSEAAVESYIKSNIYREQQDCIYAAHLATPPREYP